MQRLGFTALVFVAGMIAGVVAERTFAPSEPALIDNGGLVAAFGFDPEMKLWDAKTGKEIKSPTGWQQKSTIYFVPGDGKASSKP